MRKIITITLLLCTILLSASTATPSFYRPYIVSATGLAVHNNDGWVAFNQASFDTQINGNYVLTGDTFTATISGVSKITGNCRQEKPSNIAIRMTITGYAAPVLVATPTQTDEAFTFVFPFLSNSFKLEAYNYDLGRRDVLKCDILIEGQ